MTHCKQKSYYLTENICSFSLICVIIFIALKLQHIYFLKIRINRKIFYLFFKHKVDNILIFFKFLIIIKDFCSYNVKIL